MVDARGRRLQWRRRRPRGGHEVEEPISVGRKDELTKIAALRDVMRYVDRHHPRLAGHAVLRLQNSAQTGCCKALKESQLG